MRHPEFAEHPKWVGTGNAYFPVAAHVRHRWWVMRVNSFPDHPLWTLFVDGERKFDIDDTPPGWRNPAERGLPLLDRAEADDVLRSVESFLAYGSEIGQACDNPFCCG